MFKSVFNRITWKNITCVRYKHKENHWSVQRRKKLSTDKALEHFDDFYKQVYESKWSKLRKGLLAKSKYVAVVNNYSDSDETCEMLEKRGALNVRKVFEFEQQNNREQMEQLKRREELENVWKMSGDKPIAAEPTVPAEKPDFSLQKSLDEAEIDTSRIITNASSGNIYEFVPATKLKGREDFVPESQHYSYYDKSAEFPVEIRKEFELSFPENLNVYCYEEENLADFPHPKSGKTGVLNYYLMDGGSVLPVLALDLRPGNKMLDVCSAPGGKSLIALQTLYPELVVCNDVSVSRTNRIHAMLGQYLYDLEDRWLSPGRIRITCQDGRSIVAEDNFDRILVDVPCTTDRHSLKEDENNIFRTDRIKERLKLPELQSELLYNALKLVRVGGFVVYSTCSLSPIQNDGVVHMTLKRLWEETKLKFVVKDLNPALQQVKNVYKIGPPRYTKYGNLVLPYTSQNFGPTYFCKLQRIS